MDDPLAHLPGYALRRAADAMITELGRRLATVRVRVSDASVLLLIDGRSDLTSSEIGRILDIQRANMVPILGRLEAAGLIERVAVDRRSSAVVLTPVGRARLTEVKAISRQFEDDLMARVPEEHRQHLLPALNALWR
jgi:DNA-binding MarR family transcriptional regulator